VEGVPESVAVPSKLFTKLTPTGNAPLRVIDMLAFVGNPVVVTVKVPNEPWLNVVLFALVIAGGCWTVSVKLWVASGAMPLLALIVIE
jgi:hypothetical protein